jgi:hypothetical protein
LEDRSPTTGGVVFETLMSWVSEGPGGAAIAASPAMPGDATSTAHNAIATAVNGAYFILCSYAHAAETRVSIEVR